MSSSRSSRLNLSEEVQTSTSDNSSTRASQPQEPQHTPQPNPTPNMGTNPIKQSIDMLVGTLQGTPVVPTQPPPVEPLEAQAWVKEMVKAFAVAGITANQKTLIATYFLKGEANQARIAEGGNETLQKYERESQIGMNISGEKKEEGSSFGSSVGDNQNKRRRQGNHPKPKRPNLGRSIGGQTKRPYQGVSRSKPCPVCGKMHSGVCLQRTNVCFRCMQPGHLSKNCPTHRRVKCYNCRGVGHMSRQCPSGHRGMASGSRAGANSRFGTPTVVPRPTDRPTARTCNMAVNDAVTSRNVVSGILTVHNLHAYVLFKIQELLAPLFLTNLLRN